MEVKDTIYNGRGLLCLCRTHPAHSSLEPGHWHGPTGLACMRLHSLTLDGNNVCVTVWDSLFERAVVARARHHPDVLVSRWSRLRTSPPDWIVRRCARTLGVHHRPPCHPRPTRRFDVTCGRSSLGLTVQWVFARQHPHLRSVQASSALRMLRTGLRRQ